MKKLLSLVCALALMLTTFASITIANADDEIAELTVGFFYNSKMPTDLDKVIDKVNEILIPKANCKITETVVLNQSAFLDQVRLMLSGNEKLDAVCFRYGNSLVQYVGRGQLMALDDLMAEYGTGIPDAVGEYLKAGKIDGKLYGITSNRDLAKEYGFTMLKSVCDKYGIVPEKIKTLDDLAAAFAIIKENEPDMIPMAFTSGANVLMEYLIGVDQLSDTCGVLMNYGKDDVKTVVNYFATDEYKYWCNYFHDWYEKGYIAEDYLTTSDQPHDLLRAHRAFCMPTGLKPGFDTQESIVVGEEMVSCSVTATYSTTSLVQNLLWAIPHNATEPEAAMRFLNLLYTDPDVINLFDWGIEGEHYVFTEDGYIYYPEGVTADNSSYSVGIGWVMGNQYLSHVWQGDDLDVYTKLKEWNDGADRSGAFGFTYNSDPVKTEVASVTNVLNEYRAALEFGALDPEEALPEFLAKLEAAGMNKIVSEKQSQLDAWVNSDK